MKRTDKHKLYGIRSKWLMASVILVLTGGCISQVVDRKSDSSSIDTDALFSDGTSNFVAPMEPDLGQPVTVMLRTKKDNVSAAQVKTAGAAIPMKRFQSDSLFDYYRAQIPGSSSPIEYWFKVQTSQGRSIYYTRVGASNTEPDHMDTFWIYPGFKTPDWAKGTVLYQIFVDRFYNGDTTNDVVTNEFVYDGKPAVHIDNWNQPPDSSAYDQGGNRTREFYGGDLQGVIDKLPYLKSLGVQGIYLNPIFVSPSNHKYDTQDYRAIDPHFGKIVKDGGNLVDLNANTDSANRYASKYQIRTTDPANLEASNQLFEALVEKAHALGIKIILDGVFNHTGTFHRWFDKEHLYSDSLPNGPGAYESKISPFHSFYNFSSDNWPNNEDYESWNGFKTLPKINYEGSPEVVGDIYQVAAKWVSAPYSADGWRLDAAKDVGHSQEYNLKFWQGFRNAVKKANPNAFIFAEFYEDPSIYLMGQQWDSIMNFTAFMDPVSYLFTGLDRKSQTSKEDLKGNVPAFIDELNRTMTQLPYNSLYSSMNELDNHDYSRFLTRTNGKTGDTENNGPEQADTGVNASILRQAALMQFTWPGNPTIYYGDEAGITGWTDPDSRRTYPWGHEDQHLLSYYRALGMAHNQISALHDGSLKQLVVDGTQKRYAYGRWDSISRVAVAFNLDSKDKTIDIPVWQLGAENGDSWNVVLQSQDDQANSSSVRVTVNQGNIEMKLLAHTGIMVSSDQGVANPKP